MAYEVTATRKRPQTFDELAGQDFIVSTLKNSILQGRIAHGLAARVGGWLPGLS